MNNGKSEKMRWKDVNAIENLLNRHLQPKGITAKATINGSCLEILLESKQLPPKGSLTTFILNKITSLEVSPIKTLKISGKRREEKLIDWNQEFNLSVVNTSLPSNHLNGFAKFIEHYKYKELVIVSAVIYFGISLCCLFVFPGLALLAMLIFIVFSILFFLLVYLESPLGKAINTQMNLEYQQRLEQERYRQEQQRLKEEEERKILLETVTNQLKDIETDIIYRVLDDFRKVEARISIGVSYSSFPDVLAPAKFTFQQFIRSEDFNVCPYISSLLEENMRYYELSWKVLKRKGEGDLLALDSEIQNLWLKAANCSDLIEDLLKSAR
ncbi:hypothetical protein C7B80_23850 [Cyanosarcina cf. burmensis CCALA 770]|nr:hypothetical protein C7B80_23850 [Cyanosarcina cf. burmensis CCALA 770]